MNSEIILYQTEDGKTRIQTRSENEAVWLSQEQMGNLFQRDRSVIIKPIGNIFKEGELKENSNVQILRISNSGKPVTNPEFLYSTFNPPSHYKSLSLSKSIFYESNRI